METVIHRKKAQFIQFQTIYPVRSIQSEISKPTLFIFLKGANVNVQDQYDDTPLLWATYYGYFDVVRFLVENGSNVTIKNKYGKSALQYAEQKGFVTLADYLRPIQNGPK